MTYGTDTFYEYIRCPDTFLGNGIFIQYDVNIVIFTSCFICKSENVSMKNFKYVNTAAFRCSGL